MTGEGYHIFETDTSSLPIQFNLRSPWQVEKKWHKSEVVWFKLTPLSHVSLLLCLSSLFARVAAYELPSKEETPLFLFVLLHVADICVKPHAPQQPFCEWHTREFPKVPNVPTVPKSSITSVIKVLPTLKIFCTRNLNSRGGRKLNSVASIQYAK